MLKGDAYPANPKFAPDGYTRLHNAKHGGPKELFPRLYRGIISEQYPESLALLGHALFPKGPMCLYDLYTMALGNIWGGNYPVPTKEEMRKDIDQHYDFIVDGLATAPIPHYGFRMNARDTYHWVNDAAGTGVNELLGAWNWDSWKLWWKDPKFYKMLMDGPDVPAVYRLFDTGRGRKPWPEARAHIEKINAEIAGMRTEWKKANAKAKQQ